MLRLALYPSILAARSDAYKRMASSVAAMPPGGAADQTSRHQLRVACAEGATGKTRSDAACNA
jgi:hypothetical protein